jgi:hypothetical protein
MDRKVCLLLYFGENVKSVSQRFGWQQRYKKDDTDAIWNLELLFFA